MADQAVQYLETQQAQHPNLGNQLEQFRDLYQRKLWHQLTVKLEEALTQAEFRRGDFLIPLYEHFIASFAHKINLLKLAHIAITVAQQYSQPDDAITFLEGVIKQLEETKLPRIDQPVLIMRAQIAQYKLKMGYVQECKGLVEAAKETLDSLHDVDPSVSAQVHFVGSLYYKHKQDFANFYKSSLQYLAFISSDNLPTDTRLALAVDISLAALLGDNIYNFGELLLHPIINVLDGTKYTWLKEMLACFNHGDLHQYDELCAKYAAVLNSQPAMVENERKLRQKITILCLMELIFSLPAEQRTIPLSTIAQRTKLDTDGVELLLMKTLSLHLIEGVIDQVAGSVQVGWVQPRVLTLPQASNLKGRLDAWITKVNAAALNLEEESLIAAA
ncbi:hypothetical protein WJX72_005132 [[Myrmecia] bisecta]|uniref:PCI domain-containing protein n=1 Tax=[Myrmecia] bisecta TaxID=41462 RepID=A0AAW1Q460_9CHLO